MLRTSVEAVPSSGSSDGSASSGLRTKRVPKRKLVLVPAQFVTKGREDDWCLKEGGSVLCENVGPRLREVQHGNDLTLM